MDISRYLIISVYLLFQGNVFSQQKDNLVRSLNRDTNSVVDLLSSSKDAWYSTDTETNFVLLHFHSLPDFELRERLKLNGISLHYYVWKRTYLASTPKNFPLENLSDDFKILDYSSFRPLSNTIIDWEQANNSSIFSRIIISYIGSNSSQLLKRFLKTQNCQIEYYNEERQFFIANCNHEVISDLSKFPFIVSVAKAPIFETHNSISRTSIKSNFLGFDSKMNFLGKGVKIAINDDDHFYNKHIDFRGRNFWGVNNTTSDTINISSHSSHIAGTVGSAGNLNPIHVGFSPQSELFSFRAKSMNGIVFDNIPQIVAEEITLTQTSLGLVCSPPNIILDFEYNVNAQQVDFDIYNYPKLLHVFSAGNFGSIDVSACRGIGTGWRSIAGGYQMGKNIITVGNLDHFDVINPTSSRGPAIDNRIKPDICAIGTNVLSTNALQNYYSSSGTSMSAPAITGLLAQLTGAYIESYNDNPDGALLKAILLNSADDLGNKGPDFTYGWGKANGLRSLEILQNGQFRDSTIRNNEVHQFNLFIPHNVRIAKLMLYWTDYPSMVNAEKNLVNNLDFRILDSALNEYYPWNLDPGKNPTESSLQIPANKGIDTLNNVEQVEIVNPASGNYKLEVIGTEIPFGPQKYFLVYHFEKDTLQLTFPLGGEAFRPNEDLILRWDAYSDTGSFDIDYTLDDGRTWTPIATGVNGALRYQTWQTPAQISGQTRIRIRRGPQVSESRANFTIIETPKNIQFARVCQDFVSLTWDAVPGATSYDVFVLGEKYMDSVGTTTNTFFEPKIRYQNENWFSVRARGDSGILGRRAIAVKQEAGTLVNCAGVAPTAAFVVDTIQCDSQWVFLQDQSLKSPDRWQWAVSPNTGVNFIQNTSDSSIHPVISFTDTGSYQISLRTISQFGVDSTTRTVRIQSCNTASTSDFEPFSLRIVPNPNKGIFQLRMAGELAGQYRVELMDLQGKRLWENTFQVQGNQLVQDVDVQGLGAGVYLLRVGDGNQALVRKVVLH